MKKAFVFAVALALVAAVPAAAGKPNPQRAKIVRLTKDVNVLRDRLHHMTVSRDAAKAALMGEKAKTASLQEQLAQRTSERDAARSQAAALQARLSAIPTPLAVAELQVSREVAWAAGGWAGSRSTGELTSLAALYYAESHVSATIASYLQDAQGVAQPAEESNAILAAQVGDCGRHTTVFTSIVRHFGYRARSVQFWYANPNGTTAAHIAAEVYYGGGWHFFDPTYGLYWTAPDGSVLSITDARANGGTQHKDGNLFLNLFEDPWYDGNRAGFELDPATTVALGAAFDY